jgi:sigma-B regulation protein RsbU (phosphoserine phosphatase)
MTGRILVVEDDQAILRGLRDNLRAEDYDVLTACDGETAYRLIRDERPDLIVLDVMLPRLSGVDVCRRVRGEGVTAPIVLLTAQGLEGERINGLDAGADDYVTKPFSLNELLARIRGLLRHRREWSTERDQLQRDVRAAADVQRRLLPQDDPAPAGLDLSGRCHPALGVGGDYYDFIDLGDGLLGVVLADVAGKGITAALTMASLHGIMRTEAPRYGRRCGDLIAKVNAAVAATVPPGRYATLFYAVYDAGTRTLTAVNCGHPAPLLLRANTLASNEYAPPALEASAPPLGLFPALTAHEERLQLESGDWLLLYTDGVTDALDGAGEEFGKQRALEIMRRERHRTARQVRDALFDAVEEHAAGQPQFDDVTLIVGKVP